jgi:drug/metabolite transporter (DMT)-like permease
MVRNKEGVMVDDDRHGRREWYHSGGRQWLAGVILIVVGVVFLLQAWGRFELRNWWALFILIPAVSALGTAYSQYQRAGRVDARVVSELVGGAILLMITGVFLFELDLSKIWPVFLIIFGLGMLLSRLWGDG